MIYQSIYELNKLYNFPVRRMTQLLNISESSYYNWVKNGIRIENQTIKKMHQIIDIYSKSNGIYGSGKITAILNKRGVNISKSTTSRLMFIMGIRSIIYKHFKPRRMLFPIKNEKDIINVIKGLKIDHLNQVWTMDISYIKTIDDGNLYFISFMDLFSRKIIAWDLRYTQTTNDILIVFKKAIEKNKPNPGLIVHSDKGAQMRSKEYKRFTSHYKIIRSYTSLNHSCDENANQESFHSLMKREKIYLQKLKNYKEAYEGIYDYIENFYNPKRIHSSIGYMSPKDFEINIKKQIPPKKVLSNIDK